MEQNIEQCIFGEIAERDAKKLDAGNRIVTFFENSPLVTLNSPANAANSTSQAITFNATASDNVALANVSLYGNFSGGWAINQTNSSPVNASFHTFAVTMPDGYYKWNVQTCDTAGLCAMDASNRTLTIFSS